MSMKHPQQQGVTDSGVNYTTSRTATSIDEDDDISPMLEHYVKKHTSLVSEDKERKLSFEECCTYCDVHADNRLTNGKHKQIEAWTEEVNANMAHEQRVSSSKINANKDSSNGGGKPKLKFLKYQPIGKADTEKGFRRVRASSAGGGGSQRRKLNNGMNNVKIIYKTVDTSNNNGLPHENNNGIITTGNNNIAIPPIVNHKHSDSCNKQAPQSARTDPSLVSHPASQLTPTPSQQQQRSTQLGVRTTSNNLLNCISIDDSFRQHRGTLAVNSPWLGAKYVEEERLQLLNETIEEEEQQGDGVGSGSTTDGYSVKQPVIVSNIGKTVSNAAVVTGFDNLESTNEATNTCAYRGLYKFEKSCGQPLNDPKASRRFQKLNKNLHKMVEDFHLNGSSLSHKMKRWKDGGDQTIGEVSSLGGSTYTSRPQSGHSSVSTVSFTGQRAVRFRTKPVSSGKQRRALSANALKQQQQNKTIHEQDSANGGEDGRESFLEMIMDMDQQKSGGQGTVQIQPYLYV